MTEPRPQAQPPPLLLRSKLFVPGSRPELFAKALASAADAISFDLEDAVTATHKAQARDAVRALLLSGAAAASGKTIIVRINAWGSAHAAADLRAVALPAVHLINLPKPASAVDVVAVAQVLAAAESANHVTQSIKLLLNIESPRALRLAHELASAHPRVAGLQLGLADLFEPLGVDRRDAQAVTQALFALRMAAGEAGVWAIDSAFADIRDAAGFTAEAQQARRFGFIGKSCIHPSQVALANDVFQPTEGEIADAHTVVAAATTGAANGRSAVVVNGKMIDAPFELRARETLAAAARLGLLPR